MPIYEFKCMNCNEFIEILVLNKEENIDMKCPKCKSEELERVLSASNYAMNGETSKKGSSLSSQTKKCGSGSCTTYDIPGYSK